MLSGILLPALLAAFGVIAALVTYRGIRRGGARFYTLERELVLRRAALWLLLAIAGFMAAFGLLLYQRSQLLAQLNPPPVEEQVEQLSGDQPIATGTPFLDQFPPTPTATSSVPTDTPEPTVVVCRAVVEGTSGNGLTMRDAPGGEQVSILPEGTLLTVLEDAPVESGGNVWRKVRAVGGSEGWVSQTFLTIRGECAGGEP